MDDFVNDFAKLVWLNIKYASKEEQLSLLMLYSAVQHPKIMQNMLPYANYITQEELNKEF
ncbi:MAG: hypothetical protein PHC46_02640 [Clostridia bacterium]|nr:hypothetical protein [Clostridia bacterium]